MKITRWLRCAGRFGVMGALAIAGASLRADDEGRNSEPADKPRASEEAGAKSRRNEEGPNRPAPSHGREVAKYWLGLECYPARELVREHLNLPEGQGLVVESMVPESPADKAGLKKNDILLTANDKPLGEVQQLVEVLQASDGKAIGLKLLRGGKETTVSVTPTQRKDQLMGRRAPEGGEQVERALRAWRDQMEQAGEPIRMRFLHPGMVLPAGASARRPLPEGMRVTISREGKNPAEIEVKQGDETWKGTEDELSKAPEKFRVPVAQMLGRVLTETAEFRLDMHGGAGARNGLRPDQRGENSEGRGAARGPDNGPPAADAGPDDRLDQQLQNMIREVEQLRREVRNRKQGRSDDGNPPGPRDRRGEGPPPPPRGDAPPARRDGPPPPADGDRPNPGAQR